MRDDQHKDRAERSVVDYESQMRMMNSLFNESASKTMEREAHMTLAERRFFDALLRLMDRHAGRLWTPAGPAYARLLRRITGVAPGPLGPSLLSLVSGRRVRGVTAPLLELVGSEAGAWLVYRSEDPPKDHEMALQLACTP